jgi:hypothetical protein
VSRPPQPGILYGLPDELARQLPDELFDQLLVGASSEEELVGHGGLLRRLTRRLVVRPPEVEIIAHVGYEPLGSAANARAGSTRNAPLGMEHEHPRRLGSRWWRGGER